MTSEAKNIDCMAAMSEFPDKYFDLALVDPPYGISINMNMGLKKGKPKRHEQKSWDDAIPDSSYFSELFRVSKNQIIWGGNYFTDNLYPSMCWIVWDKEIPDGMSFSQFELAWTSFKSAAKKFKLSSARKESIHPTQKPIALYKWLLTKYAKTGDKILDTHLGSGSSRIAAYDMGFDFWGFELDPDYFAAQEKRFANHAADTSLFTPGEVYQIEQSELF